MPKRWKILAALIALPVLLLGLAALIVPLAFDANDLKDAITTRVKQATGRDLRIEGPIGLSVFPWLGFEIRDLTLGNAPGFGEQPFAVVKTAQVRVRLWPLLSRRLEVGRVRAEGVRLNLSRDERGSTNWDDLAARERPPKAPGTEPSPVSAVEGAALAALAIQGVEISDTELDWDDRQGGQHLALRGIRLSSGAIEPGRPVDLRLTAQMESRVPPLRGGIELSASVQTGASLRQARVDPLRIAVTDLRVGEGLYGQAVLQAELDVDLDAHRLSLRPLQITSLELRSPERWSVNAELSAGVTGDLAAGIYRVEDLRLAAEAAGKRLPPGRLKAEVETRLVLDWPRQTLTADDLRVRSGALALSAEVEGRQLRGASVFSGNLVLAELNPREWLRQTGLPVPATADPGVLQRLSARFGWNFAEDRLRLEGLEARLDDSTLGGSAAIAHPARPGYRFELELDRVDLDRYLPAAAPRPAGEAPEVGATPQPSGPVVPLLPVDWVRDLDLDGQIRIGDLTLSRLRVQKALIRVRSQGGQLNLDNQVEGFYQGSLRGRLGLDARGKTPKLSLDQQASGIEAGSLLQDLTGEARVTGKGQIDARLTTEGDTELAARRNLNGDLQVGLRDGAVRGLNLPQVIRDAKARLKGQAPGPSQGPVQTDFSELEVRADVRNGVLDDDLTAKSPYLRVTGNGKLDVTTETLDYRLMPVIVGTSKGAGGRDLEELKGFPIPVYVTGTWSEPKWRVDLAAVATEVGKTRLKDKLDQNEGEALERLDRKLEGKTGVKGLGQGLRDLLGR